MSTSTMERPKTLTETVTVKYVNPPKDGKKGNIRAAAGEYYGMSKPGLLDQFQVGETCYIDYFLTDSGFRIAVAKRSVVQPTQQQQRSAPVQQHVTPPNGNGNGNGYRSPSPEDKKSMFRCACITAAIKSRQVVLERSAIAALIVEVDAGYDMAINENEA